MVGGGDERGFKGGCFGSSCFPPQVLGGGASFAGHGTCVFKGGRGASTGGGSFGAGFTGCGFKGGVGGPLNVARGS